MEGHGAAAGRLENEVWIHRHFQVVMTRKHRVGVTQTACVHVDGAGAIDGGVGHMAR